MAADSFQSPTDEKSLSRLSTMMVEPEKLVTAKVVIAVAPLGPWTVMLMLTGIPGRLTFEISKARSVPLPVTRISLFEMIV